MYPQKPFIEKFCFEIHLKTHYKAFSKRGSEHAVLLLPDQILYWSSLHSFLFPYEKTTSKSLLCKYQNREILPKHKIFKGINFEFSSKQTILTVFLKKKKTQLNHSLTSKKTVSWFHGEKAKIRWTRMVFSSHYNYKKVNFYMKIPST